MRVGAWQAAHGSILAPPPGSSLRPSFWVCMQASVCKHGWSNGWPLVTVSTSSHSPLCRNQGVGPKAPTLYSQLVPWATSLYPEVLSQSHVIDKPSGGGKGLLMNNKYPFHLYGCEMFLRTEDERPNFITKDSAIALIAQKFLRVWELWVRNSEDQNMYCINHNIATPSEVAIQM